jgi:HEAT repeat protein
MNTADPEVLALVDAFAEAAEKRGAALANGSPDIANREFDRCVEIYRSLKRTGLAATDALLALLERKNLDVRLAAASLLLEFHPERAETVLRDLSTERGLVGFTAQMTLEEWSAGRMSFPEVES